MFGWLFSLDKPVQVGNELILIVTHSRPEVSDADVGLLTPAQVRLRNEDVTHGEHAQTPDLLRRVEDDRWEATGHFRIETDLDSSLNFVLALDEKIEQLLRVYDRLAEVRHQTNQRRVPLVDDLKQKMSPFNTKSHR